MRVTNSMLVNNFLRNLNNNLSRLEKTQNKLSSGKRIARPSDDPVGLVFAMRYRSNLKGIGQYLKNVDDALSWLENTDSALDSATGLIHRARELAVYGAGDTMPQQSKDALAREVEQLLEEMIQVANTNLAGRYIFAGNRTGEPPFAVDEDGVYQYHGSSQEREMEIGVGVTMAYTLTGDRVFGTGEAEFDIIGTLTRLQEALAGTSGEEPGDILEDLDEALDHLLAVRSEAGARSNRLELVKNRLQKVELDLTSLLSETEDADLAETIIELTTQENVYRASLAAGARIIQPSLIDFLR